MSTISVVIPAYNAARTILETVVSVQKQTFSDFELIVINDGSTDRTLELLNTIQDHRLKVFSYENGGLPVARNRGISHATGEFITFIDADDLWTPDKLELQLEALQKHPEAGVAYSWTLSMDEKGEKFYPGISVSCEGDVYRQLLVSNFIASGSNAMLRRQAIESAGEFDPTLKSAEDWDYWLRVAPHWSFVVVPKPQIFYRQSSNTMSSKVDCMEEYQLKVLERAFKSAPMELQSLKNQSLAYVYQYSCQLCLTRIPGLEGVKQAGQKLGRSIQIYPNIFLYKKTQTLILKLLLNLLLTPKIANYLLQKIGNIRANPVEVVLSKSDVVPEIN